MKTKKCVSALLLGNKLDLYHERTIDTKNSVSIIRTIRGGHMKTKKCVSALLLSILMILSLVPTASATESGTATVITENEKAIITVDGTVIEIPVDDSTCEYSRNERGE